MVILLSCFKGVSHVVRHCLVISKVIITDTGNYTFSNNIATESKIIMIKSSSFIKSLFLCI